MRAAQVIAASLAAGAFWAFSALPAAAQEATGAAGAAPPPPQAWAAHVQFTSVWQFHPGFTAPYQGPNSLQSSAMGAATNDLTAYLGVRPWAGAEIWINPEIDQGFGLSNTLGVAGFPSGEAYKVGARAPYPKLPRLFLRQTIDLGGERETVDADLNQLGGSQAKNRIVITLGKFSVVDVFDTNRYAHDARNDFLNWTIIDTGTFDYAANAWGYTYGAAAEWYQGDWTARAGLFVLSKVPNSVELDPTFGQFQVIAEIERRFSIAALPGALRLTGYLTRGGMGHFDDALALAAATGAPPDIALVRTFSSRGGVGLTLEQQVAGHLGVFLRAGYAEGDVEAYEFTDVDRTFAAGATLSGQRWVRSDDVIGAAFVLNAASDHRIAYLAAGGLGILVGDGRLPQPGTEAILETYYDLAVFRPARLTLDYQFIANPAFNRDRGPVSVFGLRAHVQL
jgi:high affinity Mn2+ porin